LLWRNSESAGDPVKRCILGDALVVGFKGEF